MICPKCGNSRAHRSHRVWFDWVITLLGFKPYRCKDCSHRFYAHRSGENSAVLRTSEERRILKLRRKIRWKKTKATIVLFGLSSLVFLWLLYYLIQQRIVTE